MNHPLGWGPNDGHLSRLRRLYHHVVNGGRTSPWDDRTVGAPATAENIAREIKRLERQQALEHAEQAVVETRPVDKATETDLGVFEGLSLGQMRRKIRWRALFNGRRLRPK